MAAKSTGGATSAPNVGYLHRGITRLQAEQLLLATKQDGSFLVRESETVAGAYTLCLLVDGRVHQYRIFPDPDGNLSVQSEAGVKQRSYSDLSLLIQQYIQRGLKNGLAGALVTPVCVEQDEDGDEEEGERVEEGGNLQYEIIPPSTDEALYSNGGGQTAFDDFVTRYFNQRFSHLNLSSCDGSFIDSLKHYVQDGTAKDAVTAAADGSDMRHLRKFLDEAASELNRHVESLMLKIDLCRQLFGPITTAPLVTKSDRTLDKPDLNEVCERVVRCRSAVKNLERKAELKYRDLSAMWKEGGITRIDSQFQPRGTPVKPIIPPTSFEAKVISLSSQSKIKLTVDIQAGKLMAVKPTKNVLNEKNVFTHDKIEQLIKSTANNSRLDVKIAGCKKKTYVFDDVRQRENFCQLVQQLKNMHSVNADVKRISLYVGTWNMASEAPNYNLTPWLKSDGLGKKRNSTLGLLPHDIYVIGTQECGMSEKEWIGKLKELLRDNFGEEFFQVTSASLWSIRIVILAKQEHRNKISQVQQSSVKTGIANALGNKGAIAVSLSFDGTRFCFVCCHLTSGYEKLARRNQNVRDILKGLNLGPKNLNFCDASNHFHHLFFFGDLNYRLDELDSLAIIDQVKQSAGNYSYLLEHDQLRRCQRRKEGFVGYCEEDIYFPPTYRFQKMTRDRYIWEKFKATGKRINAPSWCDRVLWRSYPDTCIMNTSYGCVDSICSSDHKPVFSSFDIGVLNQFTSAKGGNAQSGDMTIIFEEIAAEVKSTKQENFLVEFHSSCLENVVSSKANIQFGPKKDGYCCAKWTASQLPQLQPIFDDWDYLDDQHILLALKTVDGMEYYGECIISLKSAFAVTPQPFHAILTHVGEETGSVSGMMHLKAKDNAAAAAAAGVQRSRKAQELIYIDTDFLDTCSSSAGDGGTYNSGMIYSDVQILQRPSGGTVDGSTAGGGAGAVGGAPVTSCTLPVKQNVDNSKLEATLNALKANASQLANALPTTSLYYTEVTSAKLQPHLLPSSAGSCAAAAASVDGAVPAVPPRRRTPVSRTCSGPVAQDCAGQASKTDDAKSSPPLARIHPVPERNSMVGSCLTRAHDAGSGQQRSGPAVQRLSRIVVEGRRPPAAAPIPPKPAFNIELPYEDVQLRMPSTIKEWLSDLQLTMYLGEFMSKGWDHINFLCDMADDDLVQLGVHNTDHRARILNSIAQLNAGR